MAAQLTCDICQQEPAVQMLTNVTSGEVMLIGAACTPLFYGASLTQVTGAGEHKSIPSKCQACRRIHEYMTTPVTPLGVAPADVGDGTTAAAPAEQTEQTS